jgi:putative ABC transport system permease protein
MTISLPLNLRLALRYLQGRKLRTSLTTLAIALGVMIIFGLNGILPVVENSFHQSLMASSGQVDLTVSGEARSSFDASAASIVADTPGAAYVTGSLVRPIVMPESSAAGDLPGALVLHGINPASYYALHPLRAVSGRLLEAGEQGGILLPEGLAEKAGWQVGQRVALPAVSGQHEFQVIGLLSAPALGAEEVYVSLADAQALLGQAGQLNTIEAIFTAEVASDSQRAAQARQEVLERLGPGFKLGGYETGSELLYAIEMGQVAFNLFGLLAVAMGGFIIFNTFRTVIQERRRDIGMLRALGAPQRTIRSLILTESLVQGVVGTGLGMLGGYLFTQALLASIAPVWREQMHMELGSPSFSAGAYLLAIGLGLGATLISGWQPAVSASRVTPLEAMRPSAPASGSLARHKRALVGVLVIAAALLGLISGNMGLVSLGALLFLVGLVLISPALVQPVSRLFSRLLDLAFAREGQIAAGNLARQPDRAAITASAMTIGLAIIVAVAGLTSTMLASTMTYLEKSLAADFIVMPQSMMLGGGNVGAGPELAQAVRDIPGAGEVTSLRLSSTLVNDETVQVIGLDPHTYPLVSGLDFTEGDPQAAFASLDQGRRLIANGVFAAQNRLKVGDEVTLASTSGPQTYLLSAIGVDYLNQKLASVYISHAYLEQDFGETHDLLIMASAAPGSDPDQTRAALAAALQGYPAFRLFTRAEWAQEQEVALMKLRLVYVLMAVMAAPSLLALANTLGINVLERTREIGVLRAVGANRRQVRNIILAESLLLAALGTAMGILAGLWLGYVLVGAMQISGFSFPYHFPAAGILFTIATGLVFGVLAALIPARHAARLNIVGALRYE